MRRVLLPLGALILVVGTVVGLWQVGRISHVVFTAGHDLGLVLMLLIDLAPSFAGIAMGTAGILGCVLAYDRLAEDGELTAMSAAGVQPGTLFLPAWLAGLALAAVVLLAGVLGEPWGSSRYGRDVAVLATRSFTRTLRAGALNPIGGVASIYVGSARVDDDGNAVWEKVLVGRDTPDGPVVLTVSRASVQPVGPGMLRLDTEEGEALLPSDRKEAVNHLAFGHAQLLVDVGGWVRSETLTLYPFQSLEFAELWHQALEEGNALDGHKLRFFMWQKLALPLGMPLLCILGAILGAQRAPTARARGYILSALSVAAYFGLVNFGRNLVIQGAIPAWLGAQVANAVMASVVTGLYRFRALRPA
jgi:lipopolysaccharide export system permease protein